MSLSIPSLQAGYADGSITPVDVIVEVYRRIDARGEDHVWTVLSDKQDALESARVGLRRHAVGLVRAGALVDGSAVGG